jgi:pyruvate kinase
VAEGDPRRATKLICTLGPASRDRVVELVEAGMDVARVNLSHGTLEGRGRLMDAARAAAEEAGRTVGILADLSGPKVRLGELSADEIRLTSGERFELRADGGPGDTLGATTSHPGLAGDLRPGDRVLLADGAAELRVAEVEGGTVVTEVVRGGSIRSRSGVNVPAERLTLPAITTKDEADARWAVEAGADMVALSFVRRANEVRALRDLCGNDPPLVVAKIETGPAVREADEIIEAADAIMVARGDLGVELPLEEIPLIQRDLVSRCVAAGKPVIVATQMLESMTHAPRPTRAEASDVAAAVFEGSDAIMLSGETAVGEFPVEAARTAVRIAEVAGGSGYVAGPPTLPAPTDAHLVAQAALSVSLQGGTTAIACFTQTGMTAKLLSATRPRVPIYAFSPSMRVVRRLTLYRGVRPFLAEPLEDTDAMIALIDQRLAAEELVRAGDAVLMVGSSPFGEAHTNLLKVHRVGSGGAS